MSALHTTVNTEIENWTYIKQKGNMGNKSYRHWRDIISNVYCLNQDIIKFLE